MLVFVNKKLHVVLAKFLFNEYREMVNYVHYYDNESKQSDSVGKDLEGDKLISKHTTLDLYSLHYYYYCAIKYNGFKNQLINKNLFKLILKI